MGTSIHMHLEVKKHNRWLHFSAPRISGDDVFFDLVAGVRGKLEPVAKLRGLPVDSEGNTMSEVTRLCFEQDRQTYCLHHAGWLGADELVELQARLNRYYEDSDRSPQEYGLEEGYLHTTINGCSVTTHPGWDNVRLVFWFDN